VTRCSCGHIHLAVGPVTLRLEEDVLRALGHTVLEAVQQLDTAADARGAEPEAPEAQPAVHAARAAGWKQ
jgi:hypothetical protein